MSGKGDKRRPRQVSREEFAANWDTVFLRNKMLDTALRRGIDWDVKKREGSPGNSG